MEKDDGEPALQVIVLGSGGGPKEDNTTAFLVRSLATGWQKSSILAVDAGVHLAAIARILGQNLPLTSTEVNEASESSLERKTLTTGPFTGLELPYVSAEANAAHITRDLIDTYLITHPHLDHISGFVVNTASLPGARPKRLAGLPTTINAFKTHIFNNVIWPNLSDENNGAGLVTYLRLVEGGSPAIGAGEGKGYIEICEGLSVKTWSVSHGHCMEKHSHRGSTAGLPSYPSPEAHHSPSSVMHSHSHIHSPYSTSIGNLGFGHLSPTAHFEERICVYDSSAYFIRDIATGSEILIFGDVEPDSISLSPRNLQVWYEAAPKIASGVLKAVFIECSYDDSRSEDQLFGHLAPRFLIDELITLAEQVSYVKSNSQKESTGSSSTPTQPSASSNFQALESRKRKRRASHMRNMSTSSTSALRHLPSQHSPLSPTHRRDSEDTRMSSSSHAAASRQRIGSTSSTATTRHRSRTPERLQQLGHSHAQSATSSSASGISTTRSHRLEEIDSERDISPSSTRTPHAHSHIPPVALHQQHALGPLQLEQYDLHAAQHRRSGAGTSSGHDLSSISESHSQPLVQQGQDRTRSRSLVDRSLSISQGSPTTATAVDATGDLANNVQGMEQSFTSSASSDHPIQQQQQQQQQQPPSTTLGLGTDGYFDPDPNTTTAAAAATAPTMEDATLPPLDPLANLTVVIIHVKDLLSDDQPPIDETILSELRDLSAQEGVGLQCEFRVARGGMSLYF